GRSGAGRDLMKTFAAAIGVMTVSLVATAASDLRVIDAVRSRDTARVRALIKERADINARQGDGATALHWAVHLDDPDLVSLLISARAHADVDDDTGVWRGALERL